jgi:CBS domain-containing protein
MYAKDVMSKDVRSIAATAAVFDAATLLVDCRLSAVPVVDGDGTMVGIVSEADIIKGAAAAAKRVGLDVLGRIDDGERAAAAVEAARSLRVGDVMSRGVIAAHETATLREVARLMLTHRIKCIPIVLDRSLLGIVSRADLLKALISYGPSAYA